MIRRKNGCTEMCSAKRPINFTLEKRTQFGGIDSVKLMSWVQNVVSHTIPLNAEGSECVLIYMMDIVIIFQSAYYNHFSKKISSSMPSQAIVPTRLNHWTLVHFARWKASWKELRKTVFFSWKTIVLMYSNLCVNSRCIPTWTEFIKHMRWLF